MELTELIRKCKRGNQRAQSLLFNSYYSHMYNLSMRIISSHPDVEDVLISSFLRVFNNIGKFENRGEGSLEKWIKTIVINESIRAVRKKNPLMYVENVPEEMMTVDYEPDPGHPDAEQVYSIIEKMPAGYRIVFNLFAIEGYSHSEIAEMLKISENTSKSQLRKARIYISEKLNERKRYGNQ